MQSGTIIVGITGALALAASSVGCGSETTSGAGGGTTGSTTSSTAAAGGSSSSSSTAATTGGSVTTTAASSTGTGSAGCPFISTACTDCITQSCGITQCSADKACTSSYDSMRTGCACTAQIMMDKNAQNACIDQFGNSPETMAQNSCVGASCQAVCYLP